MPLAAFCLALGLALASNASAGTPDRVTVRYDHPADFTETREVRAFAPARAEASYLDTLKAYLQERAALILEPGQRLDIVVTDVDRAGSYLPSMGAGEPVRVVTDLYPPRLALRFRLLGSDSQVLREGSRKLTDLAFLSDGSWLHSSDPLRYEKRLIDRWLARGPAKL